MAGARSCKPAHPFSDGPRRCIRRTIRDCREYRSSPSVCRLGRCGNRRGIALRLGCCGRLGLRVRSCLCRCTPAIGGCRRKCCAAVRCRRSRGGYGGRCGRAGRPVGKCRSRNRLRQTAAVRRRRGRRFGRGRLKVGFQTTSMLTANEIVKEQMVQTTSKKIVRPSEKRKPRACVPHTHYTSGSRTPLGNADVGFGNPIYGFSHGCAYLYLYIKISIFKFVLSLLSFVILSDKIKFNIFVN